jgi:hypothetical protein
MSDYTKSLILLQSTVFHYHGLDENEKVVLEDLAKELNAEDDLKWVHQFISKDYFTAFERAKAFLVENLAEKTSDEKLQIVSKVWAATTKKGNGNITEMEARALLNLSKEFKIESELLNLIRSGQLT